ncbi:MAG: four helix bundle protein [Flavobacteriales bacterium]|nr:four helix bundle protein [Flavobacteriales bacterium]MEB2342364.1 four helix bundle protein [Flavobacteriia bacterium]
MKDFKKLQMWQNGMAITDMVFDIYEELPWQKVVGLKEQSIRSAISIPSNVAEGNSRRSEKDKHRFMEFSLGSAFELETQTLILDRRDWVPENRIKPLLQALDEQQKMLMSFMAKLKI